MAGGASTAGGPWPGPVDWALARRVAHEVAGAGDRPPTAAEAERLADALRLAELWLDAGSLPAAPDAGRIAVLDRSGWVDGALGTLPALVDPIVRAAGDALVALATEQLGAIDELRASGTDLAALLGSLPGLDPSALDPSAIDLEAMGIDPATAARMRADLAALLRDAASDPAALAPMLDAALAAVRDGGADRVLRPAAAMLGGLQAGQVVGRLARQVLGHQDLGVPTGPRGLAALVAVNVDEAFDGYGLDPTEVALVVATTEAAHRRLHHAVPWLDGHVVGLVGRFAAASTIEATDLHAIAEELGAGLDLDDPEALRHAMERVAGLRLEPNAAQRHLLDRLQTVVALVGAWADAEARAAVAPRLPGLDRIGEVLRRRRATAGDGERMLADLLGLDLRPPDRGPAERFVAAVADARGPDGLRRALAHPENLPDADELDRPEAWLARTGDDGVLDDPSDLLGPV